MLERQAFTETAWQFVFNGRFIDSFACPFEAARRISRDGALLGVTDGVLLPPPSLSGWEVHWSKAHGGDAPELWLHRMYMEGKPRIGAAQWRGAATRSIAHDAGRAPPGKPRGLAV